MSAADRERAEARNALARIELAASQIARHASSPAAARLARGISDAVADLDRLLTRTLAAGADAARAGGETGDVARLLDELSLRIAPALAARGVELWIASDGAPHVTGDPHLVRRAALLLARGAADALAEGGKLSLGVARASRRIGVSIELRARGAFAADEGWADEAEHFAWLHGGALERHPSGVRAVLWLPSSEGAWAAS